MANIRVLSLGAGVQSSTLAFMIEKGELEPIDFAVFADTGAEPDGVYEYLSYLQNNIHSFPIHVCRNGSLEDDLWNNLNSIDHRFASIPFYLLDENGRKGMARRQCTSEYKITPIRKKIRELLGYRPYARVKEQVDLLMGISYDEATRIKTSEIKYITHQYPLVDLKMTRMECKQWLKGMGIPEPPKSACYFCPFMENKRWKDMRDTDPTLWEKAVKLDYALRDPKNKGRFISNRFLHRDCAPLDQADLTSKHDNQLTLGFIDECEGYCGT